MVHGQRRRPDPPEQAVLLRVVLPARGQPGERLESLRRPARLREHPQRGFRQADVHADRVHPLQRQLSVLAPARQGRHVRPDHGADRRQRRRGVAEDPDGRRLVGDQPQELRQLQVHVLREPDAGTADNDADVMLSTAVGTRLDINNLDTLGRFTVPTPVAGADGVQRLRPAAHRSVRLRAERHAHRRRRRSATAPSSTTRTSSATPARSPTTSRWARTVAHDLHVGYQLYEDSEELIRSSNGWGAITVPGGRLRGRSPRAAGLLPGDVHPAGRRQHRRRSSRVPVAELRGQRHDQVEATCRSTSAC